jgi:hypothetical protein
MLAYICSDPGFGWSLSAISALTVLYGQGARILRRASLADQAGESALDLLLRQAHGLNRLGHGEVVLHRVPEQIHDIKGHAEEEFLLEAWRAVGIDRRHGLTDFGRHSEALGQLVDLGSV